MSKSKNQVYTDLEYEWIKEKHETLRMEVIESLAKQYSNDSELGSKIREFINLNKSNDTQ